MYLLLQMTVGSKKVLPAIQIIIKEKKPKFKCQTTRRTNSCRNGFVRENEVFGSPDVQSCHFIGEVSNPYPHGFILSETSRINPHGTPGLSKAIKPNPGSRTDFLEDHPTLIDEHKILNGIVGHNQIHEPVTIEVDRGHTQRLGNWNFCGRIFDLDPAFAGDVLECSITLILIEAWKSSLKIHRLAVSPPNACQCGSLLKVNLGRPLHIMTNKQIKISVIISIEKGGASTPAIHLTTHSSEFGHILKTSLS